MQARMMALAAALSLAAIPALAQQKLVLKASDVHPPGYPTVVAVENIGKKLEAATNGRLTVQMYPAMQLGGEKEMIEQAQIGALAICAHQRRRARTGDRRSQRVQPAVPVPQHRAYGEGHRRTDRQELLEKVTDNPKAGLIGICWMDGRRAQRLRQQAADQGNRRPQGPQRCGSWAIRCLST